MNEAKKQAYRAAAQTVIKHLAGRNMEGFYCDSCQEAIEKVKELVPEGSSISWGGTMTFSESGVKAMLTGGNYHIIDRDTAKTPEERRKIYQEIVGSDYFFMSANAITVDGELINIDGNGNRLAPFMHGPEHVIVLAGMNKVVSDVEAGFKRTRQCACPPNAARLHTSTPCETAGFCADCHVPGSMCCQLVVTRRSRHTGRIKVILIGEELGF